MKLPAENQMGRIESLLGQVRLVSQHYRELARATGEEFNIFQTIHVDHYEARTHTPLLAELLRPTGSHGQGTAFLELFLERLGGGAPKGFDAKSATVIEEYHLGTRSEERGGRIDILIRDTKGNQIGIENKIHAAEQENQMPRYRTSLGVDAVLVYLTLDGSDPSVEKMDSRMLTLSYREHIRGWLDECRRVAVTAPVLREGITHYLHLVESLTGQNTNQAMSEEITKTVLSSKDNFLAFSALKEADSAIRAELIKRLNEALVVEVEKSLDGLRIVQKFSPAGDRWHGFHLSTPALDSMGLTVGVECERANWSDFYYGVRQDAKTLFDQREALERLKGAFEAEFGSVSSGDAYPVWTWWAERRYWTDETFAQIIDPESALVREIVEILKRLLSVAERFVEAERASS